MSPPLTPGSCSNSYSVSDLEDFMDTDSTASQGQVMSINGVHPTDNVPSVKPAFESSGHFVPAKGSHDEAGNSERVGLHRKRKRSIQPEFPKDSTRRISPAEQPREPGPPKDLTIDINGTSKRQRIETSGRFPGSSQSTINPRVPFEQSVYGLTMTLWQRVLCSVPPVFLGRLLRVSRKFYDMLTTTSNEGPDDRNATRHNLQSIASESIWTASRKRFAPGLPKPLQNRRELEMWRLLRGNACRICDQRKPLLTTGDDLDLWRSGPGTDGVRVVWPFGTRLCGPCLINHCEKEVSLLCSSTFPSFLLQGLPYIFLTQSLDYVSPSSLISGFPPTDIQLTKYYYKPHLEEIKQRFEEVRELGPGSVAEWVKGLSEEQGGSTQDSTRWEQWETKGGLKKVNIKQSSRPILPQRIAPRTNSLPVVNSQFSQRNVQIKPEIKPEPLETSRSSISDGFSQQVPSSAFPLSNVSHASDFGIIAHGPQVHPGTSRPERNIRDVNEAKAARRADIEKRCQALEPPIFPNILIHMDSFQAALHISTPLTERAWEILKPRLLAQRQEAEAREAAIIERTRDSQAQIGEQLGDSSYAWETTDPSDREWELAQAPVRERLAAHADACITEKWAEGAALTKENAPKFAADVLLSTRARFLEDFTIQHNTKDDVSFRQRQLMRHKLTLENMKWVYDQKVKAVTEQFQKELFLCNGCEANSKFYGFEAVVQHYAAKHTNSLSSGNVVVNWRAEWPEEPLFSPNPFLLKATPYSVPVTWSSLPRSGGGPAPEHNHFAQVTTSYGKHDPFQNTSASAASPVHSTNPSPAAPTTFYSAHPVEPVSSNSGGHHQNFPLQEYNVYGPQYPPNSGLPSPYDPFSGNTVTGFVPGGPSSLPLATNESFTGQVKVGARGPFASTDLYHTQLNEMAKHARDVWFGTSGIKDIPQSVRIYVVIQHVVSRFEQKYTNEPSLSMFIDGLDHNALMRPVRSLNGLECRTCVAATKVRAADNTQLQSPTNERKLYTLPHLLNHFRTVHVEKARSTVDLQTGMESSRLDWKYDMVELPEAPLITELMNAPGIDDKKLQLIAWAFPGLFPKPLPSLSLNAHLQSTLQSGFQFQDSIDSGKIIETGPRNFNTEQIPPPQPTPTMDYSFPSPQPSNPPGEDEYDPHRPAYLGRIVESHQLRRPSTRDIYQNSSESDETRNASTYSQKLTPYHGEGAYGNQLLRHRDKSSRSIAQETESFRQYSFGQSSGRLAGGDFMRGLDCVPREAGDHRSREADYSAAADQFLNGLNPSTRHHDHRQKQGSHAKTPRTESTEHRRSPNRSISDSNNSAEKQISPWSLGYAAGHKFEDSPLRAKPDESRLNIPSNSNSPRTTKVRTLGNSYRHHFNADPKIHSYYETPEALGKTSPVHLEHPGEPRPSFSHDANASREDGYVADSRLYRIASNSPPTRQEIICYELPGAEYRDRRTVAYRTKDHTEHAIFEDQDSPRVEYIYSPERRAYDEVQAQRREYVPVRYGQVNATSSRYVTARHLWSEEPGSHFVSERISQVNQPHEHSNPGYLASSEYSRAGSPRNYRLTQDPESYRW